MLLCAESHGLYIMSNFCYKILVEQMYGTPEGTFLFQYLPEKKSKQKELERKSKQLHLV